MMDSVGVAKEAFGLVRKGLKTQGFAAKGVTFYRKVASENTELVAIQKSLKSSRAESLVTMNYGVYCAWVGSSRGEEPSASLVVAKAHWQKRWTEVGAERWLQVRPRDAAADIARVIMNALENAVLPDLKEHSSNESLRDTWLAGSSPGITEMQRLLFLALLLKKIGPTDCLDSVVKELQKKVAGTVHAGLVDYDLARAGIQVRQ